MSTFLCQKCKQSIPEQHKASTTWQSFEFRSPSSLRVYSYFCDLCLRWMTRTTPFTAFVAVHHFKVNWQKGWDEWSFYSVCRTVDTGMRTSAEVSQWFLAYKQVGGRRIVHHFWTVLNFTSRIMQLLLLCTVQNIYIYIFFTKAVTWKMSVYLSKRAGSCLIGFLTLTEDS